MTKEQIEKFIKDNKRIKEMFYAFQQHYENILTSAYETGEEKKLNIAFFNSYKEALAELEAGVVDGERINIHSAEFRAVMADMEISGFTQIKDEVANDMNSLRENPLMDPSITKAQREGLEQFHRWLQRNSDKTGFFGLGNNGSMRDFANHFMSQPASVQLKALYLLETGKRKNPTDDGFDDFNSQIQYVPNLDKIKKPLVANKAKIWKRANGSYLYWNKLSQSLNLAKKSETQLEGFRQGLRNDIDQNDNLTEYNGATFQRAFCALVDESKVVKSEIDHATKQVRMVPDNALAGQILAYKARINVFDQDDLHADNFIEIAENDLRRKDFNREIINGLTQLDLKKDKLSVYKGTKETVDDFVAQKENYLNAERIFKIVLLNRHPEISFEKAPGFVKYLNSDDTLLGNLPSNIFDGLNFTTDVIDLIEKFKKYGMTIQNGNATQKTTEALDILSVAADATYRFTQVSVPIAKKFFDASKETIGTIKDISGYALGATGAISAVKNGINIINYGLNKSHTTKSIDTLADAHMSDAESEKYNEIADFSHFRNEKLQHSAVRGMIKGSSAATVAFAGSALATVPIVGQVMLAGITGLSVYEQVKSETNRRNIARKAVDKVLLGAGMLGSKLQTYGDRLRDRLRNVAAGSKEEKKINKLLNNEELMKDRLRNKEAVNAGNTSLFTCTASVMNLAAEDLIKKVYLKDTTRGFVDGNIITEEEENADVRRERTSYKELLKSFGVNVKYQNRVDNAKEFEQKVHKEMKKQLGS